MVSINSEIQAKRDACLKIVERRIRKVLREMSILKLENDNDHKTLRRLLYKQAALLTL